MGRSCRVHHKIYDLRRKILHHLQIPSPHTSSPVISTGISFFNECALLSVKEPSLNGAFGSGVTTGIGGHHSPWAGSSICNKCHRKDPDSMGTIFGFHRGGNSMIMVARAEEPEAMEEDAEEDEYIY